MEAKLALEQAIEEISSKYNVTKETIANLIIDERKMREVNNECIDPNNTDYADHEDRY